MAYSKINWHDSPSTATPITAANLNHMDDGIYNLDSTLDIRSGTWIPTLASMLDESAPINPTYTLDYNWASYYTIGKLCYVSFHLKANITNAGTGYALVTGLPFTSATGLDGQGLSMSEGSGAITSHSSNYTVGNVLDDSTTIDLWKGNAQLRAEYTTGTLWLGFSGVYLMK